MLMDVVKEIIVVEGKADSVKVKQAVDADTIETNGSAINKQTLALIQHAKRKRGVIIFTDPDYPGERIRHIIEEAVPGCKHAFLPREQARSQKKKQGSLGIEHASIEAVQNALGGVYERIEAFGDWITKEELIRYGLLGMPHSRILREKVGTILQIGHPNGKQLKKRLAMFQITREELEQALIEVGEGSGVDG